MKLVRARTLPLPSRRLLFVVIVSIFVALASSFTIYLIKSHTDNAYATLAGFDPGNIMDDAVMANKTSMSQAQIQSFLDNKNTCKTNPVSAASVGVSVNKTGTIGTGTWSGITYHYYMKNSKFICMADQDFSGESAAHIIYQAAQDYSINPQVLLVILQKEQGLVTDNWPNYDHQYAAAMGYACPDNGQGCNNEYAGFKTQIRSAAQMLHTLLEGKGINNYPVGTNTILYNPDSSCGSSKVNVKNLATGALYTYTPYQPNKAALAAGWGTVPCGAYGNRNFYNYFTEWFGSTKSVEAENAFAAINARYTALGGSSSPLGQAVNTIAFSGHSYWIQYQGGYIIWSPSSGAWESYGQIRNRWSQLGYEAGVMGYPTGAIVTMSDGGQYQKYQNGYIIGSSATGYWESKGSIRDKWAASGYEAGVMGYPTGPETNPISNVWYQKYQNGYIYGAGSTGFWNTNNSIFNQWLSVGGASSTYGLPTGDSSSLTNGFSQQSFTSGTVIGSDSNGYFDIPSAIYIAYQNLGGLNGNLGTPAAEAGGDSNSSWQKFANGYIIGNSTTGYYESLGPIRTRWAALGYQDGQLGMPLLNITVGPDGKTTWQKYQGGYIITNPNNTNIAWESTGDIRNQWAALGYQTGVMGYPTGPEKKVNGIWSQTYQNGVIYSQNWHHWYTLNKPA